MGANGTAGARKSRPLPLVVILLLYNSGQISGLEWNHSCPVRVLFSDVLCPAKGDLHLIQFAPFPSSVWRAAVFGCVIVPLLGSLCGDPQPASAASGPFAEFPGRWSGNGTIRQGGNSTERIRCTASYRLRGSTQHDIDLELRCASDSYNFDLAGQFQADESNQVSGRWTERSRNIGGTAIGNARGDRLQIHVESSAFSADLVMVTKGRRQAVTIDSQGGGQIVKASITLSRS